MDISIFNHIIIITFYQDIISLAEFEVESSDTTLSFFHVSEDSIHKGVFDPLLQRDINTYHKPFFDDTLMSDTCHNILIAMEFIIESLFVLFGEISEVKHRSPQYGQIFNFQVLLDGMSNRISHRYLPISLSLPDDTLNCMHLIIFTTWYLSRKSFPLLEGVTLLTF